MEVSELTLKLIIILIPGVLASLIIEKLTIHKEWEPFKFATNSIVLGVVSYLLLQLLQNSFIWIANLFSKNEKQYSILAIWNTLEDSKIIPYKEILYSSLCAIIVGAIGTAIDHYKILNSIGRRLRLTNKYGQINLFSNYLNKKETTWVQIRNFKINMLYFGYVQSFCETDETNEIVLGEVSVYTCDETTLLYELEEIYLSFTKADIIIERTKPNTNGGEKPTESESVTDTSAE